MTKHDRYVMGVVYHNQITIVHSSLIHCLQDLLLLLLMRMRGSHMTHTTPNHALHSQMWTKMRSDELQNSTAKHECMVTRAWKHSCVIVLRLANAELNRRPASGALCFVTWQKWKKSCDRKSWRKLHSHLQNTLWHCVNALFKSCSTYCTIQRLLIWYTPVSNWVMCQLPTAILILFIPMKYKLQTKGRSSNNIFPVYNFSFQKKAHTFEFFF